MAISAEQLVAIDEELAGLERSDEQIAAVLVRFEDRQPDGLADVDAQLEQLAQDVAGIGAILEGVRERVASAITNEVPAAERAAEPARAEPTAEPAAVRPAAEPATAAPTAEPAPAAAQAPGAAARLSADDLFGDDSYGEEGAGSPDFAAMFGEVGDDEPATLDEPAFEGGFSLADSLEAELEGIAETAAGAGLPEFGDEEDGSTGVFSSDEIDAIQQQATSGEGLAAAEPARSPSQHPRDPEFDAILGDDEQAFRPSQHPPATADADADAGDFELLVDEDILIEEDDEYPEEMPTSVAQPAFLAELADEADAELAAQASAEAGSDDEPVEKKGFFKKLFGGD